MSTLLDRGGALFCWGGFMARKYKPYSNPNKNNPNAPWWSKTKKKLVLRQTKQELYFYDTIKDLYPKLRIIPQKTLKVKNRRFFLDFYIPRIKLAIEIDGGYHKQRKKEDAERDEMLLKYKKIKTLRFTNHQIDTNCQKIAEDVIGMF